MRICDADGLIQNLAAPKGQQGTEGSRLPLYRKDSFESFPMKKTVNTA
jgi:hypothetical protein